MVWIHDERDLRRAYENILFMKIICRECEIDPKTKKKFFDEQKIAIREYINKENDFPSSLVKDYGIDGYIELIELPYEFDDEDEVREWFKESHLYHTYHWSPYDCTGQLFTNWFKPVKRRGKWFVYHSVGVDV